MHQMLPRKLTKGSKGAISAALITYRKCCPSPTTQRGKTPFLTASFTTLALPSPESRHSTGPWGTKIVLQEASASHQQG